MAGHSKWANIKHKKAKQDKLKGKVLSRCAREIIVAAKQGGGDPAMNPRLRLAIDKARAANMTREKIENAVRKGSGEDASENNIEEIIYEGYGPHGVAIMVNCMTDNKNRTVGELRHMFSKHGGNLGTSGSVAYLFEKCGVVVFDDQVDEEVLMEVALDAGAKDIITENDGSHTIITTPEQFSDVTEALKKAKLKSISENISMEPMTKVPLDQEGARQVMKLIDVLEEMDDTQDVYSNADIPDEYWQEGEE